MKNKGFTLIELLIVVAIIGILAAIAVPNFLNAQTKAKVSRVYADMRNMKTAIESYRVDNNAYPDSCSLETEGGVQFRAGEIFKPVAYASAPPIDPFNTLEGSRTSTFAPREYFYIDEGKPCGWPKTVLTWTVTNSSGAPKSSQYLMASQGPDNLSEIQDAKISPVYDISNGLVSQGDIIVFGP